MTMISCFIEILIKKFLNVYHFFPILKTAMLECCIYEYIYVPATYKVVRLTFSSQTTLLLVKSSRFEKTTISLIYLVTRYRHNNFLCERLQTFDFDYENCRLSHTFCALQHLFYYLLEASKTRRCTTA
jgi:hypothetical protein